MALSRAQMMKELLPGLNALFGLEYERYPEEHTEIYETESSERAFEEEVRLAGFGAAPVKSEGSAITYDTAQESYSVRHTHETIALGFSITVDAVEDNLYDSLSARYTKALARGMAHTKQTKSVVPLINGFDTFTSGDSVTLFNTDHTLTGGGTNGNRPTTAADLNETALENSAITIAGWIDDRGLKIAVKPRKLIIPADLQFVATRILESTQRPGTADNDINALKNNGTVPEGYTVNHYLTDVNAWFVSTDCPNGFKMFNRTAMTTGMDGDFDTGNVRYKARERYSFGVSDPLGMYGSPGAT